MLSVKTGTTWTKAFARRVHRRYPDARSVSHLIIATPASVITSSSMMAFASVVRKGVISILMSLPAHASVMMATT